ncbi:MAG: DUF1499 domain-containing protein [Candidatus Thermoplasmatota archaeon]|nr:DUF1499 domain-containing protein [Candidatus Thermoplasmatota archaeon]MEC8589141.1 DUF1499 domain-containing protein [Candidatus Thermoplasmatota archaeon]MED5497975.1 DUF1499 domain-containing protein [Candidatus Thermoplasmatota archaeon]
MNPTASKALLLVMLIASPWLLVQVWIFVGAQDESISSMEACSEGSANCAHLGGNADYRMDTSSTIIDRSMEDIRSDLTDYISEYDCKILVEDASDSSYYVHFVERTPFWLFPDDVLVSIEQIDEDTVVIELHSQSRLGVGDMGVNPERLERIYDQLVG